ncbi:UDP binding domain-containing protein [Georgenia sp. SUBG003]|uniref:UDP binding domain-containing protein n=1 Tax=Georgenia sp. SUBG003 TaxID=1497974 RepID=UPI0005BBBC5E
MNVAEDAYAAAEGADVVLLLTEWKQFKELDPARLKDAVRNPWIIDGRNALAPTTWRGAGWTYNGIGRP